MITRRALAFWLTLALCAATVLAAMSWLTRSVLAAEGERLTAQRDRATAEARADLEERTRLALWRMDALGAAIVLRENLATADFYRTADPKRPAPATGPEVRLRFQLAENHALLTPQANPADPAVSESLKRLQTVLTEHPPECFEWTMHQSKIDLRSWSPPWSPPAESAPQFNNAIQRQTVPADQLRKDAGYQQSNNFNERNQRAKAVEQTMNGNLSQTDLAVREAAAGARQASDASGGAAAPAAPVGSATSQPEPQAAAPAAQPVAVKVTMVRAGDGSMTVDNVAVPTTEEVGPMRPVWLGGELFLLRKVTRHPNVADMNDSMRQMGNSRVWSAAGLQDVLPGSVTMPTIEQQMRNSGVWSATVLQGVWLGSAVLTTKLLQEIADLLPQARLVPATDESTAADPLALVSFPFKLDRGEIPLATSIRTTPALGTPLWMAWGGVGLAFLTSTLLVRGVLRLSERRASFVSAVTHELRTPLTTFRLYSEMLERGAVKEEKRGSYLRVLSREADRLSHLVENVLAFSRIERGNARSNVREVDVATLLDSFRERFEARLATAGLTLVLAEIPVLRVRADLAAVEHILFNLIDNAAKYATGGTPPEVELRACATGRWVAIHVSDHGPGIPAGDRQRVFRPFHKSAREAAESQPGVGLGLALSRRLARAQGGELVIAESAVGACFTLRLPLAPGQVSG